MTSRRAPRELLRSFLGAKMVLGEAQKSSPDALKSLGNDLNIKSIDVHEALPKPRKSLTFQAPEASGRLLWSSEDVVLKLQKLLGGWVALCEHPGSPRRRPREAHSASSRVLSVFVRPDGEI